MNVSLRKGWTRIGQQHARFNYYKRVQWHRNDRPTLIVIFDMVPARERDLPTKGSWWILLDDAKGNVLISCATLKEFVAEYFAMRLEGTI